MVLLVTLHNAVHLTVLALMATDEVVFDLYCHGLDCVDLCFVGFAKHNETGI